MRRSWVLKSIGVTVIAVLSFAASVNSSESRKSESSELRASVTSITPPAITPSEETPVTLPEQSQSVIDARVLLLTIRPTGFEPKEISVEAGRYLVVVRNRSGLDEFALRLERESGESLHEAHPPRFKRDAKHFLQLTPGNYILREINHPRWNCRLIVTAR